MASFFLCHAFVTDMFGLCHDKLVSCVRSKNKERFYDEEIIINQYVYSVTCI